MIANSYSISRDSYLKVSEVAEHFSVHPMTVRRACNSGQLQCARSGGGQRLIKLEWAHEWLGIPSDSEDERQRILCICRVSSRGQLTSLETQKRLTTEWAKENYPDDVVEVSERIVSGIMLDHPEVLRILDLIITNKIKAIVMTFGDRLSRAGLDLFRKLCERHNVLIHIIEGEEIESPEDQLQADLIAYLTSYTNTVSGNKCKKLYGVEIEPEHLEIIFKDWKQGLSLKAIEEKYAHLRNSKGQAYTFSIIYRRIKEHKNSLEIAYGKDVESEVEKFIKKHMVDSKSDSDRVMFQDFYKLYVGHGGALSKPKFSAELDRLGYRDRRFTISGQVALKGLKTVCI